MAIASFIVAAGARARGVPPAMRRFALDSARERGFTGMQLKAVAESSRATIEI